MRLSALFAAAALTLLSAGAAAAPSPPPVIHVPEGGRAVPVAETGVVCGSVGEGWTLEGDQRSVRPPGADATGARTLAVRVAANKEACAESRSTVLVVATGAFPEIDPASVTLFADEGRLELRGQRLKGAQIAWQAGPRAGLETCLEPTATAGSKQVQCVLPLASGGVPSDTALRWMPAGARPGDGAAFYDGNGVRVEPSAFALRPARIVVGALLPPGATVDLSQGPGRVALAHPGAVAAVDCGQARCDLQDGAIAVRSVPSLANAVAMRLRLAPRFFLARGDALETQATVNLPLVHCQLAIASGPPLRDADDSYVVVRMDPRCKETRPRWLIDGDVAETVRPIKSGDATYFLLSSGRLVRDRVVISATRSDIDGSLIGQVTAKTVAAPRPRVSLELPKHGKVDFVPTNRDAVLKVAEIEGHAKLVPLTVDGAYVVSWTRGQTLIRGDENSGGFVNLRFGYRFDGLPPELAGTDLAIISERVQRQVREASLPAPFSTGGDGEEPLVELLCSDKRGNPQRMSPSVEHRLPFEARDTCRVVIHRERLKREDGTQEIVLDVDVSRAEGGKRGDASLSQRMILQPSGEARVVPLRGGLAEFDHVLVRLSHIVDETRYLLGVTGKTSLPAVQWSLRVEGGHVRLYATAAIPAGLYRLNDPTGQLTLNFGVLSRLAWLDKNGKESLFGAELGLMGMGLIQRPGSLEYPATLGAIAGFGIRVPLGEGAAVGVHIWGAYEFRDEINFKDDARGRSVDCDPGADGCRQASRFALIFGPSISIGNVGKNL